MAINLDTLNAKGADELAQLANDVATCAANLEDACAGYGDAETADDRSDVRESVREAFSECAVAFNELQQRVSG